MKRFCIMGIAAILMIAVLVGCSGDKPTSSAASAEGNATYQIADYSRDSAVISDATLADEKLTSSATPAEGNATYQITYYGKDGAIISDVALTDEKLAESIMMDVLVKSAAWQGVDIATLEAYYLIEQTSAATDETSAYYAYLLEDGKAVLQGSSNGMYSYLSQELYDALDTIYLDLKE